MKCVGEFIYKGVERREGGEFINAQGQAIKYDESYILKLDEKTEKGIYERRLKISKNNSSLVGKLKSLEDYSKIKLSCEVNFYGNKVTVVPVDLIDGNNK